MIVSEIPHGLILLESYLTKNMGDDVFEPNDVVCQLMDVVKLVKVRNNYVSGGDVPEVALECISDIASDVIGYLMYNLTLGDDDAFHENDKFYAIIVNYLTIAFTDLLGKFDNVSINHKYMATISNGYLYISEGGVYE